VATVKQLGIPFGVVLNRAGAGDKKTEEYCARENIPVLMTIPLDQEIAGLYSRGIPLVTGMPEYRLKFIKLYENIREAADERSSRIKR